MSIANELKYDYTTRNAHKNNKNAIANKHFSKPQNTRDLPIGTSTKEIQNASQQPLAIGAIHDQGTTFGRLTENGFFWITSHAWYA